MTMIARREIVILIGVLALLNFVDRSNCGRYGVDYYDMDRRFIRTGDRDMEIAQQHQQNDEESNRNVENISVKVGQHASLPCYVSNLGAFKVIWSKNGDILTLGTTKINSDSRLTINHRYVNEWHLEIDGVISEDEGDYVCKTNGNFYKQINLEILIPPTINDAKSTPAGTIAAREGDSLVLKCYADSKPSAQIKWYKWTKYKNMIATEKQEVTTAGQFANELEIANLNRYEANMYECIARNIVPPATSRIFHFEVHFMPSVDLKPRRMTTKSKYLVLDCRITGNPLERVTWFKNGKHMSVAHEGESKDKRDNVEYLRDGHNMRVETHDISSPNDFFKTLVTLTIINPTKDNFGEYKCCAINYFGEACSTTHVQDHSQVETKTKPTTRKSYTTSPSSSWTTSSSSSSSSSSAPAVSKSSNKHRKPHHHNIHPHSNATLHSQHDLIHLFTTTHQTLSRDIDLKSNVNLNVTGNNSTSASISSVIDLKDKRRHYFIQQQQQQQQQQHSFKKLLNNSNNNFISREKTSILATENASNKRRANLPIPFFSLILLLYSFNL